MPNKGDRIELLEMHNDPNPIAPGTQGTVTFINKVRSMGFTQIAVDWDNGSTLMLTVPPDRYRIL